MLAASHAASYTSENRHYIQTSRYLAVFNFSNVFVYYRCVCSPGYVGDDCSIDYNDCEEHRCQNGAQCVDELNGYSCVCTEGYR